MYGSRWAMWVLAASLVFGMAAPVNAAPPAVGDIPPDLLGQTIDGRPVRVSDYRGRVLITTFWASWCSPCVQELSLLERLQRAAGREHVVVVGINWNDSDARYRAIRQQLDGLALTLTRDGDGRVGAAYAVRAIPRMFIVDQDGRLAYSHTGYRPEASIEAIVAEVNRLLQNPPASMLPGA